MYEKIIIALLLSGYASAQNNLSHPTTPEAGTSIKTIEKAPSQKTSGSTPPAEKQETESSVLEGTPLQEEKQGRKPQISHIFPEPVIAVIILAVMAGIIGIILFIAFLVGRLRKKSTFHTQFSPSHDTGVPESSAEIGNPEK